MPSVGHKHLTYTFQGRELRLTDVAGEVVQKALAQDSVHFGGPNGRFQALSQKPQSSILPRS